MKRLIVWLLMIIAFHGYASNCQIKDVKVTSIFTRMTDGYVNVTLNNGSGGLYLCSISQTLNSVDPDECKVVFSQLLTAYSTGKPINMILSQSECPDENAWSLVDLYGVTSN